MRVSDHQLFGTTAGSLARIKERIVQVQEQIASQQRIAKPSDDPVFSGRLSSRSPHLPTMSSLTGIFSLGQRASQWLTIRWGRLKILSPVFEN